MHDAAAAARRAPPPTTPAAAAAAAAADVVAPRRLNLLEYVQRRELYGYTNLRGEQTYIELRGRYKNIDWELYDG
jgi:hypothetical protein